MQAIKSLKQMSNVFKIMGFIPLIFVLFFGIRLVWIISTVTPVMGIVTDVIENFDDEDNDLKTVTIRYTVNDIEYYAELDIIDEYVEVGSIKQVYPKANNVGELYHIGRYVFLSIPALFSVIFIAVGYSIYPNQMKSERLLERLRQSGKKIQATITKVDHQRWMNVSTFTTSYHPIVISCRHKDSATGIETIYKTARLWGYDDSKIVVGESKVTVWINQNNPKQYVIDLETIKNLFEDPFE